MRKFILVVTPLVSASLTFLMSSQALADWTGEGSLGFNQVSGNSDSESLAAALETGYETGKWSHVLGLEAYSASQEDTRSAESYGLTFQSDYAISEQTYAFGNFRYVTDKFSGYESQAALTGGLGRHFIDDGVTLLDAEIGAGYRVSELEDEDDQKEGIVTAEATYNRVLTESTSFESSLLAESGSDNTYIEGGVALKVAMSDALALRLAYVAKHNTDVPEDTEKTDKYTTISVTYSF